MRLIEILAERKRAKAKAHTEPIKETEQNDSVSLATILVPAFDSRPDEFSEFF